MKELRWLLACTLLASVAGVAGARVAGVDVERREDVLEGRPFGLAGPYEKIVGKVRFAVSPDNPRNLAVVDLDQAPVNCGEVEFEADLYVLRPKHVAKGNGSLLVEISNRGGKGMLSLLDVGRGSLDPSAAEHFGDGFLLRQGFTLAWVGWQFDVPRQAGRLALDAPRAAGLRGLLRSDFVVPDAATRQPLGHVIAGRIGGEEYPVADPDSPRNVLTVRDSPLSPRQAIPRDGWQWVSEDGAIAGIEYAAGFEPGKIYELIYEVADPAIVGLGLVALRDFASYAKHHPAALTPADRAIAFGISQSGRFLRHFLYQGFNADEQGRRAYDGVIAHVAGAGRGSFNHRFAQPSRDGQPLEALFYPTDLYPFADSPFTDPLSGRSEGLLERTAAAGVMPKIFYTNTSYEYWGRAASLIHTTPDGKADVELPPEVRVYHLAGLQHFSRPLPPSRLPNRHLQARYVMNPNPSAWTLRALLVAMQDWLSGSAAPPPSRYPRLDEGTLVSFDTVRSKFPAIPGVDPPRDVHRAFRMDYGPDWQRGIIDQHPPEVGAAFPAFVPDVDADGNDRGGIRIPQIAVPVATYTPWNLRHPEIGAAGERISFLGAYFPFAKTEEERLQSGDLRPSLEERYESFDDYRGQYVEAAMELVERRFLRPADLDDVIARGEDEWRYVMEGWEQPLISNSLLHLEKKQTNARVRYGDEALQFGELRLPPRPGPHPVIVLIHGGCWLAEYDMTHIGALAEALTGEGFATWTLEYRRVGDPGGGWPGTFADVARGTDHLRVLAREHSLDLERVIAVGHSAGGHLALWLASRARLPEGSPLYLPRPLPLTGVLGLAAAADLAYLHQIEICGHVIDRLMGGSPADFPERYRAGSPVETVPLGVPQTLVNGLRDPFWSSVAQRYLEAARAAGADVDLVEAPGAGHFELIDPGSSTWPLVKAAAAQLLD